MITLITGTPGAGKTLYTVAEELPRFKDRKLFVDGIPDLTIDHEIFPADLDKWPEWAPDGAVLVIDEVQRIWRPRGAATKVPEAIAALETHRHKGLDFIIITQHPNLLDANVRRLVGRHIHVRRMFGWARAIVYEWDAATDPARVSLAIKRSWAYPKKAFNSYKSAVVHTARGQRLPLVIFALAIAIIGLPTMGYFAYNRTQNHVKEPSAVSSGARTEPAKAVSPTVNSVMQSVPVVAVPIYENVVMASNKYDWSQISSCLSMRDKCFCYGYNAERLMVPDSVCRSAIETGWVGKGSPLPAVPVVPASVVSTSSAVVDAVPIGYRSFDSVVLADRSSI